ncbi:MAG: Rieske (2Fe-2S) protein [Candidatus Nanopelagicaceae bacterium]|nr:Rieske (2Fe-2S) protein [Candidatus Nanopelagicaceae bacterium]
MTQIPRRVFLLLAGILIPGALSSKSEAATAKKPSPTPTPKKPTPTPKKKKTAPTKPTSQSPTPNSTKSANTSPSAQPSPSKSLEGVFIAKSAELAVRQTKVFFLKDSFGISTGYSLTRTTRGVVAFDVRCTHAGAPSALSGGQLKCPAHGSIFDPESGQVVRGPAVEPLKSYRTIESDGEIRIVIS